MKKKKPSRTKRPKKKRSNKPDKNRSRELMAGLGGFLLGAALGGNVVDRLAEVLSGLRLPPDFPPLRFDKKQPEAKK